MRILRAFKKYLTDWRNLLMHSLVGVSILAVAVFLPVKPVFRISVLVAVVGFNVLRMRMKKKQ